MDRVTERVLRYCLEEPETPKKTNRGKKAQGRESEGKTPGAKTTTGGKAKSTSASGAGKAKTTPGGKAKSGGKAKTTPWGKAKTAGAVKSERMAERLTTTLHTTGSTWECHSSDGYSEIGSYKVSWHLKMRNVQRDIEFKKGSIFYIRNTSSPNLVIELLICGLGLMEAKNYTKKKWVALMLCGEWNESTKIYRSLEDSSQDPKHFMFVVQYYYYFKFVAYVL